MPLTLIHDWVVVACQAHPLEVPTVIVPDPPAPVWVRLAGVKVYVQVLAACVTVKTRPAIVSVPVRCAALVFGVTVKVAEPAPEPVEPAVTVIQATPLVAVQLQPVVVVTAADPFAPAAGTDWLVGEIENAHADAFCVTVNVWPPIVTVPVRDCVAELAVALNVTVPPPVPLAPPVTVSQLVLLLTAVQLQPVPAVTLVSPVPLPEPIVLLAGEIVTVQATPAWVTAKV